MSLEPEQISSMLLATEERVYRGISREVQKAIAEQPFCREAGSHAVLRAAARVLTELVFPVADAMHNTTHRRPQLDPDDDEAYMHAFNEEIQVMRRWISDHIAGRPQPIRSQRPSTAATLFGFALQRMMQSFWEYSISDDQNVRQAIVELTLSLREYEAIWASGGEFFPDGHQAPVLEGSNTDAEQGEEADPNEAGELLRNKCGQQQRTIEHLESELEDWRTWRTNLSELGKSRVCSNCQYAKRKTDPVTDEPKLVCRFQVPTGNGPPTEMGADDREVEADDFCHCWSPDAFFTAPDSSTAPPVELDDSEPT